MVKKTSSDLGLNRGLSSNFLLSRSANHTKFTEYVMCTEMHILVKKYLQMGSTLLCHSEHESKR